MINTQNYFDRTESIDFEKLPEALAKGHALVSGAAQNNWEHYKKVDTIKRVVDAYFEKLESYLKANPQSTPSQPAAAKPKSAPKPKASAPKKQAKEAPKAKPETPDYKVSPRPTPCCLEVFGQRYLRKKVEDGKTVHKRRETSDC